MKTKNKQGISLIVLVITIIVMIILAAAVILSLSSSGVIDRANEAVDKTDEAQVKTLAQTIWADAFLDGKRGAELIETVETGLKELGVTAMDYTIDISDSGMDIQKFDAANWEFAYTYDQETAKWSDKILATSNPAPEGDIIVKFYNLGKEITPPSFEFMGQPFVFNPGNAYKMVIQGTGEMGAVMATSGSNIVGVSAWQLDTLSFVKGVPNIIPIIPYVTEAVIDEGVTNIGEYVFCGASGLKKITIANSVQSIGEYTFLFSESLNNVTIPNGVTSIELGTFYGCNGLTSVTIPNSVTSIANQAFFDCNSLTSVAIPNSVTSIGNQAFFDCKSLTSVTIPNSVTSIGIKAFYNCNSLTTIYYTGTEEQWSQITIGGYNEELLNANIIYNHVVNN